MESHNPVIFVTLVWSGRPGIKLSSIMGMQYAVQLIPRVKASSHCPTYISSSYLLRFIQELFFFCLFVCLFFLGGGGELIHETKIHDCMKVLGGLMYEGVGHYR